MNDIFISYARADQENAKALAEALGAKRWTVWWDRTIPAGKRYDQVIEEALANARCIIVLWSKKSITSDWVRDEAEEGRSRGILVPVLIEDVRPPMGFRSIQAATLVGWNSRKASPEFDKLVSDIAGLLAPPPPVETDRREAEESGSRNEHRTSLATSADTFLSNDQITQCISYYLTSEFREEHGIDLKADPMAMKRLKEATEKARNELSKAKQTDVNLPFITADASGPKHLNIKLTRSKVKQLIAIIGYLTSEFQKEHGIALEIDTMALERLTVAAEKARMELTSSKQTDVNLPFITADASGPKHLNIELTQSTFKQLISLLTWPI
jgi:hypothetical protein